MNRVIVLLVLIAVVTLSGCYNNGIFWLPNNAESILIMTENNSRIALSTGVDTGFIQLKVGEALNYEIIRQFRSRENPDQIKEELVTQKVGVTKDGNWEAIDISQQGRIIAASPGTATVIVNYKPSDLEATDEVRLQVAVTFD